MFRKTYSIIAVACVCAAVGCETQKQVKTEPTTAKPAPAYAGADGRIKSSYAYPTGHVDTSALLLERDLPKEIVKGQEFTYNLKVTNVGHSTMTGVTLHDECATDMSLIRATPMPTSQQPPLVWSLGEMKPNETKTVQVVGKMLGSAPFTSCASVSYNSMVCLTSPVVEPALQVALTAPADATPCDTLPVRMTVTNTGTGAAKDVRLSYPLPNGWKTADGKTTAQFTIDELASKQSREFSIEVKPSTTGSFNSVASVTGSPDLKAQSLPAATTVRQAVLGVDASAPEKIYSGRHAVVKFIVTNKGTAPATSATVEAPLPSNTRFVSATEGGAHRAGMVIWNVPSIAVNASREYSMTVEPTAIGSFNASASAKAYCAATASDSVSVQVLGIPALLLEVTDLMDPIEVGSQTEYEIVITNQGTATATNVKIVATLENNQQFIEALGGKARADRNVITFDSIPSIAPKSRVTLRMTVACVEPGDTRFKISMTADQLDRPVEETESTHIYR